MTQNDPSKKKCNLQMAQPIRTFEQCIPAQYPRLLHLLDAAFDKPETNWFAKYYCHVFQKDPKFISRNYFARQDGEDIGAVGIFPQKFKIGRAVLNSGSIGSVATVLKYRRQGVMSYMLGEVDRLLRDGGYDISWLSGERFRYGNYGWEKCGRLCLFELRLKDIPRRFPELPQIKLTKATRGNISKLSAMYRRSPSRVIRSTRDWELRLARRGYNVLFAEGQAGCAYCVFDGRKTIAVVEIGGKPMVAIALLAHLMKRTGVESVKVMYPGVQDALAGILYKAAEDYSMVHQGMVRIVNPDSTWQKLLPEIERANTRVSAKDTKDLRRVSGSRDRDALLGRVLGFFDDLPALPPRLRKFEWFRPIPWWISSWDTV